MAEFTPRDWTADESATIKHAYRNGHYPADLLFSLFPAECDEVELEDAETRAGMFGGCVDHCRQPIPL